MKGGKVKSTPAKAPRNHLNRLVAGQTIQLKRIAKDRYGRTVGELFKDRINIQQQMVVSGHGEIYWQYAHQCDCPR